MTETKIEPWQRVFREALVPLLSRNELLILRDALERDEPTLLQGQTVSPPGLECVWDWPVEGACLIAYPAWKGRGLTTVGEVESAFAQLVSQIDACFPRPDPLGAFALTNFFDDRPRPEMRRALVAEIDRVLGGGTSA
jgi:hypothetical protein